MIVVNFKGGLGNQMFQYALYRSIKEQQKMVYADKEFFYSNIEKRDFELHVFGITLQEVSHQDALKMRGNLKNGLDILKRKFGLYPYYYRENSFNYNNDIYKYNDIYLDGYWQSEKYFKNIDYILRRDYKFPQIADVQCLEWQRRIKDSNSISIHVRRGDYMVNNEQYGGICTKEYYVKAIKYIKEHIDNPHFFVFSDDIIGIKEELKGNDISFVSKGYDIPNYVDMQLMSLCKHNIIANSSFSWWATWLNQNEHKITIAPKQWINGKDTSDIYCSNWIVL